MTTVTSGRSCGNLAAMTPDVTHLISFYRSPLGRIARALVREQVVALSGDVRDKRIVGLGFATPYLRHTLDVAERVIAFMPGRQGASAWPREDLSHTVLCDPLEMPLNDAAVDLVVAVHAFEHVADGELMRELWRVVAPNGYLVIVVPRRRGLWAQIDSTPFGQGHPYSVNQLERLLRDHSFKPEEWRGALFVPPFQSKFALRSTRVFERAGRLIAPAFSGVICVRAKKQAFPAVPRRTHAQRFVRVPGLSPQAARNY